MKRFLAGILSIIYLIVASGMVVSIHFCMGKQTGVEYRYHAGNRCDKCGMANKNGCCHDEFKLLKISDDQQLVKANVSLLAQPELAHNTFFTSFKDPIQGQGQYISQTYLSPPDLRQSAIYRYISVFRI